MERRSEAGGREAEARPGRSEAPESAAPVRRGYLISGRVQGVGFRWWTTRNARELGLVGTVRNRRDGDGELHVEGPEDAVSRLEERLREGPPSARVEGVRRVEAADSLPHEFRIVR